MVKLDGLTSQSSGKCRHLHPLALDRRVLIAQRLIALDAVTALGAACACAAHNPLIFPAQNGLPLALACLLHLQPLGFQFQITCVVGLIAVQHAVLQLDNAIDHAVEEVTVMGNQNQTAVEADEVIFQPCRHLHIQMVGRLVQDQ